MAEVSTSDDNNTGSAKANPFTQCNGRTYLSDSTLPYPLPVDLTELHRQALRTLLLMEVYGGPLVSQALTQKTPKKVLELGCGSGFWSIMCHRYFKARGVDNIEFVGLDIAQLPVESSSPSSSNPAVPGMKWTFIQHDLRNPPWPFPDGEFDLVLSKDMTLVLSAASHPHYMDENLRVLKRGGTIEVWETDHTVRMLRPHLLNASSVSHREADEHEATSSLGVYIFNMNTSLAAPQNAFLIEYNDWLRRALEAHELMANPCTRIKHYLLQETDLLTGVGSKRVAIPMSETQWEHKGVYVANTLTRDDGSHGGKQKDHSSDKQVEKNMLTAGQAALRRTALLTLVEEIQALELPLRKINGKNQHEWDSWVSKMKVDLICKVGTYSGECLEAGVWWAQKK